jgi:thiosulfate/3-mercaptopyruvate sulfurtransferase
VYLYSAQGLNFLEILKEKSLCRAEKVIFMFTTLISAEELSQNLHHPHFRIIDCRFSLHDTEKGRNDYREAHLPGALYVHLDEDLSGPILPGKTSRHPLPTIAEMEALFSRLGIDSDTQVVIYDYKSGGIAARLWWMLQFLGHRATAVLNGGWFIWQKKHLPVSRELNSVEKTDFKTDLNTEMLVNAQEVEEIRKRHDFVLIDSRSEERYQGKEEPIDPVAGHIPGAVNLPFKDNVEEASGIFKEAGVLAERFRNIRAGKPAEKTVFYCGSGVTACHNILAMQHALDEMPRLYAGSWSEWITEPERPVEVG